MRHTKSNKNHRGTGITTTQPLSMGLGTAAGLFQSLFGFVLIMVTNMCIKFKNPEYALF